MGCTGDLNVINRLQEILKELPQEVFYHSAFMNLLLMTQPVAAALPPYWAFSLFTKRWWNLGQRFLSILPVCPLLFLLPLPPQRMNILQERDAS